MDEHKRRPKGEGGVVRAGKGWRARIRVRGELVYGVIRHGETARERAKKDCLKLAQDTKPGRTPTLKAWAHECLSGLYGHRISVGTFQTNDSIRRCQINPNPVSVKRLEHITRRDCMKFASEVTGSAAWVRRVMAFLSTLFSEAMDAELIDFNPCVRLRLPDVPERQNRVLAAHEAIRLMNPSDLYGEMLFVYMNAGFRRAELCRARHRDLTVQDRIFVRGTKNAISATTMPLLPEVVEVLRRQPQRGEFIFSKANGEPIEPATLTQWFRRNKVGLGLPPEMRLQDLRGTFVTLLIESGADMKTTQTLARHASITTTAKSYARSHFDTQEEALAGMSLHVVKKTAARKKKDDAATQGQLFG
jgi:integrase